MDSNTEKSLDNFSIQDTMEMGTGDQQLLNDLLSPETSTADADEVEEIVKTTEIVEEKTKKPAKIKEITDEGDDTKKEDPSKSIEDFLGGGEEDDEEEEAQDAAQDTAQDVEEEEGILKVQYDALANDLFNLGVFTKDEDEEEEVAINTPEEFRDRFIAEKKKGAIEVVNNFIGQFGEDYQNAFDAIFVKGVNPKEYFNTYNSISSFKDLDISGEENESNQIKVIKQALVDQGWDQEDLDGEVDRLKNYGDLENVAAKHHKVLVKKEALKLQQMEVQAQENLQQKAAFKNQYITNVQQVLQDKLKTKEFDGIPINPKLASELHDFLLVDKWKTPSGENLTDFDKTILELKKPQNHEMKVKVGLILKILEKDPSLSTIQKTGITKKSNQLFGELAKQVVTDKTSRGQKKTQPKSWFSS